MCTRDEVLTFSEPVLFPSVPVTYAITMEGSSRYNNLIQELKTYRPTRTVVIVHHKSMSECARPAWVKSTADDLWNNNLMIAKRNPDAPVLILEDDVHFLPAVREYAAHIDTVIAGNQCELYSLGVAPLITFPSSSKDLSIVLAGSSQAVLFSTAGRQRLLREYGDDPSYKTPLPLHDLETYFRFHALTSMKPCAAQPHPPTLNRQQWDNPICRFFFYATGAEQDGTLYYQLAHVAGFFGGLFTLILLSLVNLVLLFTRAPSRGKLP